MMTLTTAGSRRCRRLAAVAVTSLALPAFGLAADQASAASGDCGHAGGHLHVQLHGRRADVVATRRDHAGHITLYRAQGGSA